MKKKIRVLLPNLVIETLEHDARQFEINRETICNQVIIKLGHKSHLQLKREIEHDKRSYLQFNLNKICQKVYHDILNQTTIKNESQIVRSILNTYVNYHPFVREYIIFRERITYLEDIYKRNEEVIVSIDNEIVRGKISSISRCQIKNFRKVKIGEVEEYLSKVKLIN